MGIVTGETFPILGRGMTRLRLGQELIVTICAQRLAGPKQKKFIGRLMRIMAALAFA